MALRGHSSSRGVNGSLLVDTLLEKLASEDDHVSGTAYALPTLRKKTPLERWMAKLISMARSKSQQSRLCFLKLAAATLSGPQHIAPIELEAWIEGVASAIVSILKTHDEQCSSLCIGVWESLVIYSMQSDEIRKSLVQQLKHILPLLKAMGRGDWAVPVMSCLSTCCQGFGKSMRPFLGTATSLALENLIHADPKARECASHLLRDSFLVNPLPAYWEETCGSIIWAAHQVVSRLRVDVEVHQTSAEVNSTHAANFMSPPLPEDTDGMRQQFSGYVDGLRAVLQAAVPETVQMPMSDIVNLIMNALSVAHLPLPSETHYTLFHPIDLMTLFPVMGTKTLELMLTLLEVTGRRLLTRLSTLLRLLKRELHNASCTILRSPCWRRTLYVVIWKVIDLFQLGTRDALVEPLIAAAVSDITSPFKKEELTLDLEAKSSTASRKTHGKRSRPPQQRLVVSRDVCLAVCEAFKVLSSISLLPLSAEISSGILSASTTAMETINQVVSEGEGGVSPHILNVRYHCFCFLHSTLSSPSSWAHANESHLAFAMQRFQAGTLDRQPEVAKVSCDAVNLLLSKARPSKAAHLAVNPGAVAVESSLGGASANSRNIADGSLYGKHFEKGAAETSVSSNGEKKRTPPDVHEARPEKKTRLGSPKLAPSKPNEANSVPPQPTDEERQEQLRNEMETLKREKAADEEKAARALAKEKELQRVAEEKKQEDAKKVTAATKSAVAAKDTKSVVETKPTPAAVQDDSGLDSGDEQMVDINVDDDPDSE